MIRIDAIDLSLSKPNKDFGSAFYLSPDLEQAKEMASLKTELLGGTEVVTEFKIDSFDGLRVKSDDFYSEEWAHFVYLIWRKRILPTGRRKLNLEESQKICMSKVRNFAEIAPNIRRRQCRSVISLSSCGKKFCFYIETEYFCVLGT